MPSITYDGRSFMLDGRRIWLVSGTIPYAKVCREHWADRILAAKLAGLNTIDTPIFWNRHEPRPGKFDFAGQHDLRHFVELVHQAGMYCILRLGPFVDHDWDFGGLPAWLPELKGVKLRAANHAFLEACSRYINAVANQVRDLQITAVARPEPGAGTGPSATAGLAAAAGATAPAPLAGGPIILIQNESSWTCGDQDAANGYLGELVRYVREAGFDVPLLNDNNLWQGVESEIDCWSGREHLLGAMRQMASVRADQPRIIVDFDLNRVGHWGIADEPAAPGWLVQRQLAEALAGGGQFNLQPFCGGTAFGFMGGRSPSALDLFNTPTTPGRGLLHETCSPSEAFRLIRRLCTFASRFARVFSALDPAFAPVTIDPVLTGVDAQGRSVKNAPVPACTVTHAGGSQGGVVFVFGGDPADTRAGRSAAVMMPDGVTLPIDLGSQAVAWCLMNTHLHGRANLDYCTLNALALVGKVFVCFGVAGARGMLSINGSPLEVSVPTAATPSVIEHEGIFVVIMNEETADHTYFTDEGIYVGVQGLTTEGSVVVPHAQKTYLKITGVGEIIQRPTDPPKPPPAPKVVAPPPPEPEKKGKKKDEPKSRSKKGTPPPPPPPPPPYVEAVRRVADHPPVERAKLGAWTCAPLSDYTAGTSARYASIAGPADLSSLGAPYGYGWYRLRLKNSSSGKTRLFAPGSGDRLHLFSDGTPAGVMGFGPVAQRTLSLGLKKPAQTLVVLAENFGRFSGGAHLGEPKGLASHLLEVEPVKVPAPKTVAGEPLEVLQFRTPLWEIRKGDVTSPQRITWTIPAQATRRGGLLLEFHDFPGRGLIVVNDKPVAYADQSGPASLVLEPEALGKGAVTIQISPIIDALLEEMAERGASAQELAEKFASSITFASITGNLTAKAEWAFARWEIPADSAFKPPKGKLTVPAWWRVPFTTTGNVTPLILDLAGLTKGQVYLNGHHVARYFVAADGKRVAPLDRIWLPDPWLNPPGIPNDLLIFDEQGAAPVRCRLSFETGDIPIRAWRAPS